MAATIASEPHDVLLHMFGHVPQDTRLRLGEVCKRWHAVVDNNSKQLFKEVRFDFPVATRAASFCKKVQPKSVSIVHDGDVAPPHADSQLIPVLSACSATVQSLELGGTMLNTLPPSVYTCEKLTTLNLESNSLTKLPPGFGGARPS